MSFKSTVIIATAFGLAGTAGAGDFDWKGQLESGQVIEIKGVNGSIEARGGDTLQVTARKKAKRDDPESVKVEVVEHADGITICAVYPSKGKPNECQPGQGGRMSVKNNDVSVHFEVQIPAGIRFVGRTVNGSIEAHDLGADAEAYTVNGGIKVSTSGNFRGQTVNGGIKASMGSASWRGPLNLETVNGGITVRLPAEAAAKVSAKTVHGGIETDFPLTVKGKFAKHSISGTIGSGGGELNLETVNGGIRLLKSS